MSSREWTQKEVQTKFLTHLWHLVDYWERESRAKTSAEKLQGLLHSFLVTLDGGACDLPGYDLIPRTHPEDKPYHIEEGENYYRPYETPDDVITVHGEDHLHELMHDLGRRLGLCTK